MSIRPTLAGVKPNNIAVSAAPGGLEGGSTPSAASSGKATGIYSIVDVTDGKRYVGSATDIRARWSLHRSLLNRGKHHSPKLQNAWIKHGPESFRFEVLLLCNRTNLFLYEQAAIDAFDVVEGGFNVMPRAGRGSGRPVSDATRERMSRAHAGKKKSKAHAEAVAAAQRGRVFSEAHKEKLAAARRGKPMQHAIEAMRKANVGRKMSPESISKRQASRAANRAKSNSLEY